MLPLLDYSTKKAQMLQEYHAQLEQQLAQGEPWADAHTWAILTGEVDVLIRETLQLYTDLIWMNTQMEAQIETLFHEVRDLLVAERASRSCPVPVCPRCPLGR